MRSRSADDAELERFVAGAADGDEDAWRDLWKRLEPRLFALVRKRTILARLARREDECRDVVVAVMARLRENGFHRLRLYLAARGENPDLTFVRWLVVVAKRVAIDCLRAHPDYIDRRRSATSEQSAGVWIEAETLPSDGTLSGGRPPMTDRVTARQILRYGAGVLSDQQRRALELWAELGSCDDIARSLELDGPEAAERLVRAAVARLRRHFREDISG